MDSNDVSMKLAYANALLAIMIDRFEGKSTQLVKVFGGQDHTDVTNLHLIRDLVEDAKEIVDAPEVPNA